MGSKSLLAILLWGDFLQWKRPCDPIDLVYFRKRIGEEGVLKIFQGSEKLHGKEAEEKEVVTDTTVMEKNITFPIDTKLQVKIIKKCVKIAEKERIALRQKYPWVVKKCLKRIVHGADFFYHTA
jgi:IS5 family transposase